LLEFHFSLDLTPTRFVGQEKNTKTYSKIPKFTSNPEIKDKKHPKHKENTNVAHCHKKF